MIRVNYLYKLYNNIIEINEIPYNIQQKGQYPIIADNNRDKMNISHSIDKLAKLAITIYLTCLTREGEVE